MKCSRHKNICTILNKDAGTCHTKKVTHLICHLGSNCKMKYKSKLGQI